MESLNISNSFEDFDNQSDSCGTMIYDTYLCIYNGKLTNNLIQIQEFFNGIINQNIIENNNLIEIFKKEIDDFEIDMMDKSIEVHDPYYMLYYDLIDKNTKLIYSRKFSDNYIHLVVVILNNNTVKYNAYKYKN